MDKKFNMDKKSLKKSQAQNRSTKEKSFKLTRGLTTVDNRKSRKQTDVKFETQNFLSTSLQPAGANVLFSHSYSHFGLLEEDKIVDEDNNNNRNNNGGNHDLEQQM